MRKSTERLSTVLLATVVGPALAFVALGVIVALSFTLGGAGGEFIYFQV